MVAFKGKSLNECLKTAEKMGVTIAPVIAKQMGGEAVAAFDVSWHQLRRPQ